MREVVDPQVHEVLGPLLVALHLEWAVLWVLVAYHYGRAAHVSWRVAGGRWRRIPLDVAAPFVWGLREFFCSLRLGGSRLCETEVPSSYQRGNLLRFAIFLGSLTPAMFGFYYMTEERSGWSSGDFALVTTAVLVSMLAAGGHLFLAYKSQPGKWARMVTLSAAWLLAAPPLLSWMGWA